MIKTVLVTGASAGIGRATAIYLVQNGYEVYGAARRLSRLKELKTYGVVPVVLDIVNEDSIDDCVRNIFKASGKIDILVNCAGLGSYGALEDVAMKEAKNQMDVNLFGLAYLTQRVLPSMRNNRYGKIINISSIGGKVGLPMGSWYHASKFAVEGLSDSLRNEVRQFGIDVIVVQPGGTKSEMIKAGTADLERVSGNTVYSKLAKSVIKMYVSQEKNAIDATRIAKLIKRGIESRNPKTRYVARNARVFLFMRKILSDSLFDKMLMSQLK